MALFLVMLAALVLVIVTAIVLTAHSILRPPRMTDGKAVYLLKRLSPGDLAMQFEEMRFSVRDEHTGRQIEIASWWMPNPGGGDKTVVLIHGYADAKVGSIAWAPTWRQLGYHILAIDLRAHGESGGKYTTAGVFERHDLDQILNQFHATHPQQTQSLVLFGVSLGAAVALATAVHRDDIASLVLESPIANFRAGVMATSDLLGVPLFRLLPLSIKVASWIGGANLDEVQSIPLISQSKCPVMVIQAAEDLLVGPEESQAFEAAIKGRADQSIYWRVEGVHHLLAIQADPDEYRRRIEAFIRKDEGGRMKDENRD